MRRDFDEIRACLELEKVAEDEGLSPKRRRESGALTFACPACHQSLSSDRHGAAMSNDKQRWKCIRCDEKGDVIDLLRLTRGLDASGAIRLASDLAGLDADSGRAKPGDVWKPKQRPSPSVPAFDPLSSDDEAERMRAIRLAWLHLQNLTGLADGEDIPSSAEHLRFIVELGGLERMLAARSDERRQVALAYLRQRMGLVWNDAKPFLGKLVAVAPASDSGLRGYLQIMGGTALVEAGEHAGLFRKDGSETFAGCLVYAWTDERGVVTYLTGRQVPGLRDWERKGEALPVFNPERRGDRIGVRSPSVPFGAHLSNKRTGSVAIVEGELDAVHELVVGPAIATGGTGRMGNAGGVAALKHFLAGRDAVVSFDSEPDPTKQTKTDERAERLATMLGVRWMPGGDL
jgi:hypothetical protein